MLVPQGRHPPALKQGSGVPYRRFVQSEGTAVREAQHSGMKIVGPLKKIAGILEHSLNSFSLSRVIETLKSQTDSACVPVPTVGNRPWAGIVPVPVPVRGLATSLVYAWLSGPVVDGTGRKALGVHGNTLIAGLRPNHLFLWREEEHD